MDISYDFSDLFYGIDMDGKALMRDKFQNIDIEKNERRLMDRYKFLYNHSYIILCLILDGVSGFLFYEEISKKTNLRLYDIDISPYKKEDNLNIGEVLEEFLLSDKDIDKTLLYRYVESVWASSPRISGSKKKSFISSENIGFSDYDKAVKFIFDFAYSFISSQEARKTFVYEEGSDGKYKPANSIVHGCKTIYEVEIKEKFDVLDRYYDILKFVNDKDQTRTFDKGIYSRIPVVEKSLVSYNSFIRTFASDYRTRGSVWENTRYLSLEQKKELYFTFHDEIPFDYDTNCINSDCNSSFNLYEDRIFYLDDKFKTICPCCGKVQEAKLPDVKRKLDIKKRIINRSINDDLLESKVSLLSELVSLGGMDKAKNLVKERK